MVANIVVLTHGRVETVRVPKEGAQQVLLEYFIILFISKFLIVRRVKMGERKKNQC